MTKYRPCPGRPATPTKSAPAIRPKFRGSLKCSITVGEYLGIVVFSTAYR
jgi:hypothetical protein